jgi:hypothetical protein
LSGRNVRGLEQKTLGQSPILAIADNLAGVIDAVSSVQIPRTGWWG